MTRQEAMPVTSRIAAPEQAGQGRGLAHRPGDRAEKGLGPAPVERLQNLPRLGGGQSGQRRGAADAAHGGPHLVAGHLGRVGEKEKGPGGQGRVHEIAADPAEHLLGEDHAETDAERHLPQGDGRRQGQGEEQAGDEKGLGKFMAADQGEDRLPEAADDHRDDVDRQEVQGAMQHVREVAGRDRSRSGP